jgi:GMP synthase-like glutamine amidotransferase
MRIGLLECDHVDERLLGIAGDYRDMFDRLLAVQGLEIVPVDACRGELPSAAHDFDGYVCTGSRHSAYDDQPWIHELSRFIVDIADAGVPFVGICFGHQVLAHALGGEVRGAESGWGVGPHDTVVERSEPWTEPSLDRLRLQYMHQDQVVRLPDGANVVGSADHCPIAVLRAGERMLGIQAHPEFPAAYVEALMSSREDRIEAGTLDAARRALAASSTDEDAVAAWITAFLRYPR